MDFEPPHFTEAPAADAAKLIQNWDRW